MCGDRADYPAVPLMALPFSLTLDSYTRGYELKAIMINPENRSMETVEINSRDDIARLIGFDTIAADEIGKTGDQLYFDEDCFLRDSSGRFQLDSLAPVAGKAVIAGGGKVLCDVAVDMDSLRNRIKYL
jgi:hypothetical protein